MNVPAALAHVFEPRWLEAVQLALAASHRVETNLAELTIVEFPNLMALGILDELRCGVLQVLGQATNEHVGWLDKVIID